MWAEENYIPAGGTDDENMDQATGGNEKDANDLQELFADEEIPHKPLEQVPPTDEFVCPPCDTAAVPFGCPKGRIPKTLNSPIKPSAEAIADHYTNHLPYRNWCPICVKAKAQEAAHRRGANAPDKEDRGGLPTVSMDYNALDKDLNLAEEKDCKLKTIVVKDETTGEMFQHKIDVKGIGDEWLMKRLVKDFEELGRRDMALKTDGEPAMLAVQSKIQSMREGRTVLKNPPAYNPESNGVIEKGVKDVTAHTRALKLGLESRLKIVIEPEAKIVEWLLEHAAFCLSKFNVGHDGMTPHERKAGQKWRRPLVEIGEVVHAKLVGKKRKKGKKDKQRKKLAEQSIEAIWVGQMSRTGEHMVVQPGGDAFRCRTVRRVPVEDRWSPDKILAIEATPRRPTPSRARNGNIEARVADESAGVPPRIPRVRAQAHGDDPESGAHLDQPEACEPEVRDFRITNRILDKYGLLPGCPGCDHKAVALPGHRGHSRECRLRLQQAMADDETDKAVLEESKRRMQERGRVDAGGSSHSAVQASSEPPTEPVARESREARSQGIQEPSPDVRKDEAPTFGAAPETPRFGAPELEEEEDGDAIMELTEQNAQQSNEENKRQRDEDSDEADGEPNTKRAKLKVVQENHIEIITEDESGVIIARGPIQELQEPLIRRKRQLQTMAAQSMCEVATECKNQFTIAEKLREEFVENLKLLNSLRDHTEVKQLLQEIDEGIKVRGMGTKPQPLRHDGHHDVAEVYSPPRITEMAKQVGLEPGWALDLTEVDVDDGQPWDFSVPAKREKAKAKLDADKPFVLMLCPMCGPFSSLQNLNYVNKDPQEVRSILERAMEHIKFTVELCLRQQNAGRLFIFEHPAGASSWESRILRELKAREGVFKVNFDFCEAGMKTGDKKGDGKQLYPVKKRTGLMTNSYAVYTLFREAQCKGDHVHAEILDGRASECQKYPPKFCKMICEAIKREKSTLKWRNRMCKTFDVTHTMSRLMKVQEKFEAVESPPEEDPFAELYEGLDFIDDISGAPLVKELAIAARRLEIEFFRNMGVYTKIKRESWMKVITTKWIDQNKGDSECPNYRARLVGREIKRDQRTDLFAATPPLESLRLILSICASNQGNPNSSKDYVIMYNDVKRAYFYAPAKRPVYIKIPDEDFEDGDENKVGVLNLSLYGTRDAAQNWAAKYTGVLENIGFVKGVASPCNFYHAGRGISMTVHGDDFTSTGSPNDLKWLEMMMGQEFEMTTGVLGPGPGQRREVRILNRAISWQDNGITYEADPRHAEIIIGELDLRGAKPVATPGTRDEAGKSGPPQVHTASTTTLRFHPEQKFYQESRHGFEDGDANGFIYPTGLDQDEELLNSADAKVFRGLAARLNYLAQDRPDLQYAAKEASRRMARPSERDWCLLKRIGRYLVGAPRAVQTFAWQSAPETLDTYVDSDWAGCASTCRSTSGGAVKLGWHCLKSWSSTQATVAMSSAEAELFSLTKGASTTLGMLSVARDLGLELAATVHSDASAALAIAQRQGLGKLRHLKVQYLWVQERVRRGDLGVKKVHGKVNPADLLTKHLNVVDMTKHVEFLGFETSASRSEFAPKLHGNEYSDEDGGNWEYTNGGEAVMHHLKPRKQLFTPLRVRGAPPLRSLTASRVTIGRYCDNGEEFRRVDNWTTRSTAHLELSRRWKGCTVFLLRDVDGK